MAKQGPQFWVNPNNDNYALKYDADLVQNYSEQIWHIPLEIERIYAYGIEEPSGIRQRAIVPIIQS